MAQPKSFGLAAGWPMAAGWSQIVRAPVAGDVMLGGNRPQWPTALSSTATASSGKSLSDTYFSAPPWAGSTIYLALPAFYVSGGNERPLGNDLPIGYVTIFREDGTAVPALIQSDNYVIPNMSCRLLQVTCPFLANEHMRARIELNVPVGARWPVGMFLNMAGNDVGEGRESGSTASNEAKRLTGALTVGLGNAQAYGPSMIFFNNWDGVTPVSLGWGDSRTVPTNDFLISKQYQGAMGCIGRGVTSAVNGRHAYASVAIAGAYAQNIARDAGVRITTLESFGNRPFTQIWTTNYGNDLNGPATPPTLDDAISYIRTMAKFFAKRYPGVKVRLVMGFPWATDNNLTLGSTVDGQTPTQAAVNGGVQSQLEAWAAGGGLPGNMTYVNVRPYMADSVYTDRWSNPGLRGTFDTLSSSRVRIFRLPRAPAKGDNAVISVGLANVESFHISDITDLGGGLYSCNIAEAQLQTHVANTDPSLADKVWISDTRDLVHPGTAPNIRAIPAIEQAKIQ